MIVKAKLDGQVIVKLLEPVPADKRGTLLLDLEAFLKESIDPGLVVWLEPFGDRSSLRNLHGILVIGARHEREHEWIDPAVLPEKPGLHNDHTTGD